MASLRDWRTHSGSDVGRAAAAAAVARNMLPLPRALCTGNIILEKNIILHADLLSHTLTAKCHRLTYHLVSPTPTISGIRAPSSCGKTPFKHGGLGSRLLVAASVAGVAIGLRAAHAARAA